jgi:hypothetical protein
LSIPEPFIPPLAQEIGSLLSLSHNTVVTVPSADCPACELPVLTTGTISCDATAGTYSVSYITDGTTVTASAGTVDAVNNSITDIPLGKQPSNTMQVALPSSTASSGDQFLLPTLQQLFSGIVSYPVIDTIVQANAVGYILGLKYDSNITSEDHGLPSKFFVKHIDATEYIPMKKTWNDLRRTLMYARTETRFYSDFAPLLRKVGFDAISAIGFQRRNARRHPLIPIGPWISCQKHRLGTVGC